MGAKIVTLANVHSKLLGNSREVYVYLPPSYAESKNRRYPVLYAQDGQHMFASDAKGDSWEMHQTAERLSREGRMEEVIIVAVSSISDQRGSEYFHNHPGVREAFHTTCKGELYERFLIEELKPMIDARFRTLTDREHTAIIGSSAGGLVSYHIAFRRPDVFGQVAILSPFLVHAVVNKQGDGTNQQEPLIEQKVYHSFPVKPPSLRVWVDIGGAEGLIMPRASLREGRRSGSIRRTYRNGKHRGDSGIIRSRAGRNQRDRSSVYPGGCSNPCGVRNPESSGRFLPGKLFAAQRSGV